MKSRRQTKILEIINLHDIETQGELADQLKNAGFSVTQATISRDIREMKLMKVSTGNGHQKYTVVDSSEEKLTERYLRVLRDGYVDMDRAGNLVVIRTVSGMAMAVAAAIDAMEWSEVAGCIAGDDTIFCAVHTTEEASQVMEKIRKNVFPVDLEKA